MKGHSALGEEVAGETVGYIGRRHAQRIISDFYAKGIVRGAVECTNLCIHACNNDVTAAETMKSSRDRIFAGGAFLSRVECANGLGNTCASRTYPEVDARNPMKKKVTTKSLDIMYGLRGANPRVFFLSPFEFTRHWEVRLLRYPRSIDEEDEELEGLHASLTPAGRKKLGATKKQREVDLIAGEDYIVKQVEDEETSDWLPFPDCPATRSFRHEWIMVANHRPVVPVFEGCPLPKSGGNTAERNARILMSYFHPWVLDPAIATEGVPHVTGLHTGDKPWVESMNEWLEGNIMTEESARYIRNFLCVNRMRSRDKDDDADCRSDDLISDEELELSMEELAEALETRIGGKQPGQKNDIDDNEDPEELTHFENSRSAIDLAQAVWAAELTGEDKEAHRFPKLPKCTETVFKAARDSQRMDPWSCKFEAETRKPSLGVRVLAKTAEADAWLAKVKQEVNAEQFDVINKIVDRVMLEER